MNAVHGNTSTSLQQNVLFRYTPDGRVNRLFPFRVFKKYPNLVLFKVAEGRCLVQLLTQGRTIIRSEMELLFREPQSFNGFLFNVLYHGFRIFGSILTESVK